MRVAIQRQEVTPAGSSWMKVFWIFSHPRSGSQQLIHNCKKSLPKPVYIVILRVNGCRQVREHGVDSDLTLRLYFFIAKKFAPVAWRPPQTQAAILMEVNLGMLRRIKGFTLIELLIVIAIILILIAIALPNFLEAQIRARVTKAMGEMRSLSTAVFDYNTALISASKEGIFPPGGGVAQFNWKPWTNASSGMSPNAANNNFHACSVIWVSGSFFADGDVTKGITASVPPTNNTHYDLRVMTSPIEALTSVPLDPFKNDGGFNSQYDYFGVNLRDTFVFRSLGPDGIAAVGCGAQGFRCNCNRSANPGAANACLAWKGGSEKGGPSLSQTSGNVTIPGTEFCTASQTTKGCKTLADALRIGVCAYSPTNGTKSPGDLWKSEN